MSLDVGGALAVIERTQVRAEPPSPDPAAPKQKQSVMQTPKRVGNDGFVRLARSERDERQAAFNVLLRHFYPVGHPNLRVVDKLDLGAIGSVGRVDEVGKLTKAVLVAPHALSGDFFASPLTSEGNVRIDTQRAFTDHARFARELLDRGTLVYLLKQPGGATEAVYATDAATGFEDQVVVSSPREQQRRYELLAYTGGIQLDRDFPGKGPVEWGDMLRAVRDGKRYVVQGYNSMRGTIDSVERVARLVHHFQKQGAPIVHVPIQLAGAKTLHLDYATNYAGQGATRSMVVAPHAIADQNDIARLQWIFGASERNTKTVGPEAMLRAAANIACPNPGEAFVVDNPYGRETADFLQSRGVSIILLPFHMEEKDGLFHCCLGQLERR